MATCRDAAPFSAAKRRDPLAGQVSLYLLLPITFNPTDSDVP
jgi:hypothetical protein